MCSPSRKKDGLRAGGAGSVVSRNKGSCPFLPARAIQSRFRDAAFAQEGASVGITGGRCNISWPSDASVDDMNGARAVNCAGGSDHVNRVLSHF